MIFSRGINPLSVEINHGQIATIISNNDTINIKHRDNFENKVFPQYFGHTRITEKEIYNVLDYIRSHTLSRMDSWSQKNTLFLFPIVEITYDNIVTIISSNSLTQSFSLQQMFSFRVRFNFSQVELQFCVCIRIAMCDINSIIVV